MNGEFGKMEKLMGTTQETNGNFGTMGQIFGTEQNRRGKVCSHFLLLFFWYIQFLPCFEDRHLPAFSANTFLRSVEFGSKMNT